MPNTAEYIAKPCIVICMVDHFNLSTSKKNNERTEYNPLSPTPWPTRFPSPLLHPHLLCHIVFAACFFSSLLDPLVTPHCKMKGSSYPDGVRIQAFRLFSYGVDIMEVEASYHWHELSEH